MKPTLQQVLESAQKVYQGDPPGWLMAWRVREGGYQMKLPAAVVDRVRYMIQFDYPDADITGSGVGL